MKKDNKIMFLDSAFGTDNVIKNRRKISKLEIKKVNVVIEYQINRIYTTKLDYNEWNNMYNLLYSLIPYQLCIDKLTDLAILLYGVIIELETYEDAKEYKNKHIKLYNDLIYSNIFSFEKNLNR